MNRKILAALHGMALAGMSLAAAPAGAADLWSIQQVEMIQTRTVGQGYALGFARNIGTVAQSDVVLNSNRGIGLSFSNTNVFGSSEAFGMAASVNGQASVNVLSAQAINNLAGAVRTTVR